MDTNSPPEPTLIVYTSKYIPYANIPLKRTKSNHKAQ